MRVALSSLKTACGGLCCCSCPLPPGPAAPWPRRYANFTPHPLAPASVRLIVVPIAANCPQLASLAAVLSGEVLALLPHGCKVRGCLDMGRPAAICQTCRLQQNADGRELVRAWSLGLLSTLQQLYTTSFSYACGATTVPPALSFQQANMARGATPAASCCLLSLCAVGLFKRTPKPAHHHLPHQPPG